MKKEMKIAFILALIINANSVSAQKFYLNPKFDSLTADHRLIAILPFDVSISLRPLEQNQLKEGDLETMQKKESLLIQRAFDAYFFKRQLKKEFKINIQDIDSTNDLIKTKGWDKDSLQKKSPGEICSLLAVDAIISGTFSVNRPVSMEISTAFVMVTGFPLATISGDCNMNIYNGNKGELLWQYKKYFAQGPTNDINYIISSIMKAASRKLPYKGKK